MIPRSVLTILLIIQILAVVLMPFTAYGNHARWHPLVPCGLSTDNPATPGTNESQDCTTCHLVVLVDNAVYFLLFDIIWPFAIVMIIIGGMLFILSGGNEKMVSLGKSMFWYSIIGFVVAFGAWIIVDEIMRALVVTDSFLPWNKITCEP
ncbi:MAG: hypothetical protein HY460_02425 [Parcubacteria group bacterium]|nr:hypothetical protein [Parcubacteria group bacterium]